MLLCRKSFSTNNSVVETVIHTPEFLSLSLVLCSHISFSAGSRGQWFQPGDVGGRSHVEVPASGTFARRAMMVMVVSRF